MAYEMALSSSCVGMLPATDRAALDRRIARAVREELAVYTSREEVT